MTGEIAKLPIFIEVYKQVARANALLDKYEIDDFYRFRIVVLPVVVDYITIEFSDRSCWEDDDDIESISECLADEMGPLIRDSDLEPEQLRSIETEYPELKDKIEALL